MSYGNRINIGDYIQSLAALQFIEKPVKYLNRERLDEYNEEHVKLIMNGWFLHECNHWPPSNKILPIFMDVKTSKDTSINGFRKEWGNYDYALQIAYYYTYLSQFEDIDPKSIYILAVGNTAPYLSSLFHINVQLY